MAEEPLAVALEREHHEIDAGIESFLSGLGAGQLRPDELGGAVDALRRHIYLEEEFLFPPIKNAGLIPPILVMLREHGVIWRTLDTLEEDLADLRHDGDSFDRVAGDLIAGLCRELLAQLDAHNSKEEPVIYPQGDAVLSEDAKNRLQEFISVGRMPAEWICEQA